MSVGTEKLQQLKNILLTVEQDFVKFYDQGNQAAGTRIRNKMQELKSKAQEIRLEVQEIKNKD